MRFSIFAFSIALITLMCALQASDAGGKKQIKATQTWASKHGDNDLAKLAPSKGFLTEQKAFEELWTGWKLKDKAPKIDFAKEIVVVTLATGGPNVPRTSFTLEDNGNVKVLALSTQLGGPGFGYSIDVLNREGIKSIQGKAIEEDKK
jgi:hypothetical protein